MAGPNPNPLSRPPPSIQVWEARARSWLSSLPSHRRPMATEIDGWVDSDPSMLPEELNAMPRTQLYRRILSVHRLLAGQSQSGQICNTMTSMKIPNNGSRAQGVPIPFDRMDDLSALEDLVALLKLYWLWKRTTYVTPHTIVHTARHRGRELVDEMLYGPSGDICWNFCRMDPKSFLRLCETFRDKKLLRDTRFVSVEEQMRIFLETLACSQPNRQMADYHHHSGETISRHFNVVLQAMCSWAPDVIKPMQPLNEVPNFIRSTPKYWPFYRDCIGAIGGTRIPCVPPKERQMAFIFGRETRPTQNVLAVCDFNMRFTFVAAGWEGSAHDARMLENELFDITSKFPRPPNGKYYVLDSGFPSRWGFLTPYRNVQYHETSNDGGNVRRRACLFNRRHSSLRNIIECCFVLLKKRFQILEKMPSYPYRNQVAIVVACMALHNFIRVEAQGDTILANEDAAIQIALQQEEEEDGPIKGEDGEEVENFTDSLIVAKRDEIRDEIGESLGIPPDPI